jgi:hypothetical protein
MGLLRWLWHGLKWLAGLFLPFLGKARDFGASPALRWVLHLTLVALVLAGLGYLNYTFDLAKFLEAPWVILRRLWLPTLFLLLYLLAWLGWWLWRLLGPDSDPADFPDIDRAWQEGLRALDEAGLNVKEVPLFLVLGYPPAGEPALFRAARLSLRVRQAPPQADAPVHVFADAEGIYVTCAGASLLGRQAVLLAGDPGAGSAGPDEPEAEEDEADEDAEIIPALPAPTAAGGGALPAPVPARTQEPTRRKRGRSLVALKETPLSTPRSRKPMLLLKDADEAALLTARLQHLCRLIVRARRPSCPVNGLLVLLPYYATESDVASTQTGLLFRQDLRAARAVLQVHCPLFALVCGLEEAPGCRELLGRFPRDLRQRRVGQQFPYVPDLDPAEVPTLLESGLTWIFRELFPPLVYRLFRLEKPGRGSHEAVLRGNLRLYQFLAQLQDRHMRLTRTLTLAVAPEHRGPCEFAGCYVAATGTDPVLEQAFVGGVFRRLIESQDYVSWTDAALAREAEYRRWTVIGYLGLAAFLMLFPLVAWVLWRE